MSVNFNFEKFEYPEMVLAYRGGTLISNIQNVMNLTFSNTMSDPAELSFVVYKQNCPLWDKIRDERLIWIPDWNDWYILKVTLSESDNLTKTVTATHLPEKELSCIKLYGVEINSEDEMELDNYEPTIFWNEENTSRSLLHRLLKNAPNYTIAHVDESLADIQRIFSFDDSSIYDAFQEVAEKINCQFIFNAYRDSSGKLVKTVSAYDLEHYCNDCGYRSEFEGNCPECGSTNIYEGYGEDTTVFLSLDNFVNDNSYSTNADELSTCFKLETGDEDLTAAVVMCNPNGTSYLWRIPEYFYEDMSPELVAGLKAYNTAYEDYKTKDYTSAIATTAFNKLIDKYAALDTNFDIERIDGVVGYNALMEAYATTMDMESYLQSELYPQASTTDISASQQGTLLTTASLGTVAVEDISVISVTSASNAVLGMAKTIIDCTRYKIEVIDGASYVLNGSTATWTGAFYLENYSDEDDNYTTSSMTVTVNEDVENYIKQKLEKTLAKGNTENYSVSSLFKKDLSDFTESLKIYGLTELSKLWDEAEGCLDILQQKGLGDPASWQNNNEYLNAQGIYTNYTDRQAAIEAEMEVREAEIKVVQDLYNEIESIRKATQKALNLENYLGDDLWNELLMFRKDDTYSNSDYISDGLTTAEQFQKAQEFYEVAEKEIKRASEIQHTIDSTLKHLLAIDECKPILSRFCLGNWLRLQVDETIFKLRLIGYEIPYDSFDSIDVTFSDAKIVHNDITDVKTALQNLDSIVTSYGSTRKQAEQGSESKDVLDGWSIEGLDATLTKIVNNADNQDIIYDSHGLLLRSYDDVLQKYDDKQVKLMNSTIAFTDDGWNTVKTALGRFYYTDPSTGDQSVGYGVNGETIVGKLILGEDLGIYNSAGSLKFNSEGLTVTTSGGNLSLGTNGFVLDSANQITINSGNLQIQNGNVTMSGAVTATSGKIGCWTIDSVRMYNDTNSLGYTGVNAYGNGAAFWAGGTDLTGNSAPFRVDHSGVLIATNANISGTINATSGTIANFNINGDTLSGSKCGISSNALGDDGRVLWAGDNFLVDSEGGVFVQDLVVYDCIYMNVSAGYLSTNLDLVRLGGVATSPMAPVLTIDICKNGSQYIDYINIFGEIQFMPNMNGYDSGGSSIQAPSIDITKYASFNKIAVQGTAEFDGGVKVNSALTFNDWYNSATGGSTYRRPVASASTDSTRVGYIATSSSSFRICGQWGGNYDTRTISVSSSDIRLKDNVSDSNIDALSLINRIQIRQFDWKDSGEHQNIGFIADELEELDSKLTIGGGYTENGMMDVKGVNDFYLLGYLTKAIQELSNEVESLKSQLKK